MTQGRSIREENTPMPRIIPDTPSQNPADPEKNPGPGVLPEWNPAPPSPATAPPGPPGEWPGTRQPPERPQPETETPPPVLAPISQRFVDHPAPAPERSQGHWPANPRRALAEPPLVLPPQPAEDDPNPGEVHDGRSVTSSASSPEPARDQDGHPTLPDESSEDGDG